MIYDTNENIYTESDNVNDSKEVQELIKELSELQTVVDGLKDEVDGFAEEFVTGDLEAVNANVTSEITTPKITAGIVNAEKFVWKLSENEYKSIVLKEGTIAYLKGATTEATIYFTGDENFIVQSKLATVYHKDNKISFDLLDANGEYENFKVAYLGNGYVGHDTVLGGDGYTINAGTFIKGALNNALSTGWSVIQSSLDVMHDLDVKEDALIEGHLRVLDGITGEFTGHLNTNIDGFVNSMSSNYLNVDTKLRVKNEKVLTSEIDNAEIINAEIDDAKIETEEVVTSEISNLHVKNGETVSMINGQDKYIVMEHHSTGDDYFIAIEPFNGNISLRLVKDDNDILSVTINETYSEGIKPSFLLNFTDDNLDYLKKVELVDGVIYLRTFGDGKLYYHYDTIGNYPAPKTYWATRPNGEPDFNFNVKETKGIISNSNLSAYAQNVIRGSEVTETINNYYQSMGQVLLEGTRIEEQLSFPYFSPTPVAAEKRVWLCQEAEDYVDTVLSADASSNPTALLKKIDTDIPINRVDLSTAVEAHFESTEEGTGEEITRWSSYCSMYAYYLHSQPGTWPIETSSAKINSFTILKKICSNEFTGDIKVKFDSYTAPTQEGEQSWGEYYKVYIGQDTSTLLDNTTEFTFSENDYVTNNGTWVYFTIVPTKEHSYLNLEEEYYDGPDEDQLTKSYLGSILNEFDEITVTYTNDVITDLDLENLTVSGSLTLGETASLNIPSTLTVQTLNSNSISINGHNLVGTHTTTGEFNENLIYPATQFMWDDSDTAFDGVFYEKANFMTMTCPTGTKLIYVDGGTVKFCGTYPPYSGLRYGGATSVNANKTWFNNISWLGTTTLSSISYTSPTIDIGTARSVATQEVQAFVDYRQNAINDLLDKRSAEALYGSTGGSGGLYPEGYQVWKGSFETFSGKTAKSGSANFTNGLTNVYSIDAVLTDNNYLPGRKATKVYFEDVTSGRTAIATDFKVVAECSDLSGNAVKGYFIVVYGD